MSLNIYEAASSLFSPELINKAGFFLSESETNVSKAIKCIVPTVIKGIASRSASNEGANTISLLAYEQYSNPVASNINDFFGEKAGGFLNPGSKLLNKLFGDKAEIINQHVANYSGIGTSSSMSLLSMATPVILGLLGEYASTNRLDAVKVAALLNKQKDIISKAMPTGYMLNDIFNNWENAGKVDMPAVQYFSAPETTININATAEKAVGYLRWLLPLMIAMLIATFFFTCNN